MLVSDGTWLLEVREPQPPKVLAFHASEFGAAPVELKTDNNTAYIAYGHGISFVDITNPSKPVHVEWIPINPREVRDIDLNGKTLVVERSSSGLIVIDVTTLVNKWSSTLTRGDMMGVLSLETTSPTRQEGLN